MPFLEFEDIDKSFGSNNVISKFNLKVEKGEFIVLLGPSGCGKSTLLRMIAGLEKIDGGKITLESILLNDLLPSKRKIAMVFQSYALYPHMNVFQNISFGLTTEKITKTGTTAKRGRESTTPGPKVVDSRVGFKAFRKSVEKRTTGQQPGENVRFHAKQASKAKERTNWKTTFREL